MALEKNLSFSVQSDQESIPVYCDPEKIIQVLRNLLFNAIKFSDEGTVITILSKSESSADGIGLQKITISNYGTIIPDEELESIFGEFIQSSKTKTGAGGTGLGLAIARQILRGHNCRIIAKNGTDGSTIFQFNLPQEERQLTSSSD